MRKDVPEKTSLPRDQGRTELMGTGVPEVIVLEARAALGTLRASERKRENILLSIHRLIEKPRGIVVILKIPVKNFADSYNLKIDLV